MSEANRDKLKRAPTSVFLCTDEKLYKECRRYKQMALVHPLTPTQQAELDKRDLKLFAKTVDRLYQCILQKDAEQAAYKQKVKVFAEKALAQRDEQHAKALAQRDEQHAKALAQRDEEAQASYNQALLGYREKIQDLEHEKQTLRAELQEVKKAHTKELQQLRTIMASQQSQLDTLQKAQSHLPQFVQMMQSMVVAMGPMVADMGVAKGVPLATAPAMPSVSSVVPVASPQQNTAATAPAMPTIPPVPVASAPAPPAAPKAPPPMPPSAPAAPPSCATTTSTTRERNAACDEPPTKKRRRRRAFEWVDLVAEMLFPEDTVQQQQLASQLRLLVCTVPDGTKAMAEARATAFATLVCEGVPARAQYEAMVHTWRTLLTSTEAPKAQAGSFAQRVYHVCDDEGVGQGVIKGTKQARHRILGWLMTTRHDTAFVRAMMCLMQC